MANVFKDPALQAQFEAKGYVKFPLLNHAEVADLLQLYLDNEAAHHQNVQGGFHGTSHTENEALITRISHAVLELTGPALQRHLQHYKFIGGNFLIKDRHTTDEVPPHQDWTYVEEPRHWSAHVWIALRDVPADGGALFFIDGSHRMSTTLRTSPGNGWMYAGATEAMQQLRTVVPLKAGEALLFNNATIHGSVANTLQTERVAAVVGLYDADSALYHYYQEKGSNEITRYTISQDDFIKLKFGKRPEHYQQVEPPYTYIYQPISNEEFKALYAKTNGNWWSTLLHTLNLKG